MAGLMDGVNDGADDRHEEDGALMGDGGEGAENQEDGAEGTEGTEESESDEEQHDEAKNGKLPEHVQKMVDKRIGKEVGRRKTAEERAERAESELKELRERVDAEDADIVLDAARQFGIVAEALPKGAAKGMEQLRGINAAVEQLTEILEDQTGEEVEVEGKPYKRADVRARLKQYRADAARLSSMYGSVEAQAKKEMLDIFRLGQQAKKAGWKPGQKAETAKPKEEPTKKKPQAQEPEGDEEEEEPPSRVRGAENGKREAEDSRSGPFSLEAFYAQREKAKAKRK